MGEGWVSGQPNSFASTRHTEGFLKGLAISPLIALIALIIRNSETWSDFPEQFFDFAAIPSSIWIAYIGWQAISKQIANDREMEQQRNLSLLEAARASLRWLYPNFTMFAEKQLYSHTKQIGVQKVQLRPPNHFLCQKLLCLFSKNAFPIRTLKRRVDWQT